MSCTTILVGKNASYDGSTLIARNDDSGANGFTAKKFVVIEPHQQQRKYKTVLSNLEIDLPDNPLKYTAMPNAVKGKGIWAASGINEENIAMTATETITSNPRVLGADPLVEYDEENDIPGGIGEEDIVYIVLPYIHSAREGVERLGMLLEKYGTYEMNGIAFQDVNEIWWLETIGGHHWIAKRVLDDFYVVMPNQFGIDEFDLEDALGKQENHMCSKDLQEFIDLHHLNVSFDGGFNARDIFGSHDDSDHIYNTPCAWIIEKYLNPHTFNHHPEDDDIPWSLKPEKKITIEDVKYVLSSHFQGTDYDPYKNHGDLSKKGMYRPIGINRNDFVSVIQLRPYMPQEFQAIEWIAYASNVFNALVPFYGAINETPDYLSNTTAEVSTDNFYWSSRLIAAMADASYRHSAIHIERYQRNVMSKGHQILFEYDQLLQKEKDSTKQMILKHEANQKIADMLNKETSKTLSLVLNELSHSMKNAFARSDA